MHIYTLFLAQELQKGTTKQNIVMFSGTFLESTSGILRVL